MQRNINFYGVRFTKHIFGLVKFVFVSVLSVIAAALATVVVFLVLNSFFEFQQSAYQAALIY